MALVRKNQQAEILSIDQIRQILTDYINEAIHKNIHNSSTFRNVEFSQKQLVICIELLKHLNYLAALKDEKDLATKIRTVMTTAYEASCQLYVGPAQTKAVDAKAEKDNNVDEKAPDAPKVNFPTTAYENSLYAQHIGAGVLDSVGTFPTIRFNQYINFNHFVSAEHSVRRAGHGTAAHTMLHRFCTTQVDLKAKHAVVSSVTLQSMYEQITDYVRNSIKKNTGFSSLFRDTAFSVEQNKIHLTLVNELNRLMKSQNDQPKSISEFRKDLQQAFADIYTTSCKLFADLAKRHKQDTAATRWIGTLESVNFGNDESVQDTIVKRGLGTRGHHLLFNFQHLISAIPDADLSCEWARPKVADQKAKP